MKVIADICVVPIGVGVSVSRYIAVCETVLEEAGLRPRLHAYGTMSKGEWEEVFAAIKACHERSTRWGHRGSLRLCASAPASIVTRPWRRRFAASRAVRARFISIAVSRARRSAGKARNRRH